MGSLVTAGLLLGDDFEFKVLFRAILETECGIDDVACLATTCKLARCWTQMQVAQCSKEDIASLLLHMEETSDQHHRRVTSLRSIRDPGVVVSWALLLPGSFLWQKDVVVIRGRKYLRHCSMGVYCGITNTINDGSRCPPPPNFWYQEHIKLTAFYKGAPVDYHFNRRMNIANGQDSNAYARFHMFDDCLRRIFIQPWKLEGEDAQRLKSARLGDFIHS
jgi:hypothetical protein